MFPVDSKLRKYTLKTCDGSAITHYLLTDYRSVTTKIVTMSTAWNNTYGYFTDTQQKKHTLGREMSWSLLHLNQHVQVSLHTDVDLLLQQFSSIQHGGQLFFSLFMKQLVLFNEQSCDALISLVQSYNVSTNEKDDLKPGIKLLC